MAIPAADSHICVTPASASDLQAARDIDQAVFAQADWWAGDLWAEMLKIAGSRVFVASKARTAAAHSMPGVDSMDAAAEAVAAPVGFVAFERSGKLMKLGVAPVARQQGVGRVLLAAALLVLQEGEFKKFALAVSLHVEPTSASALRLYTAHTGSKKTAWRMTTTG